MALLAQSGDQGIIAQTGAAKHFAGARRQLDYSQWSVAGHQKAPAVCRLRRAMTTPEWTRQSWG
jgi:hypothetical protein